MERSLSTKVSQRLTSIRRWRSTKSLDDFRPRSPKRPVSASTTPNNDFDVTTEGLPSTDPLFSTFLDLGPDFSEDCLDAFGPEPPSVLPKNDLDHLFEQTIQEEDEDPALQTFGAHGDLSTPSWQTYDWSGQPWETQSQQHSISNASKNVCAQCLQAQYVNDLGRCMVCQYYFESKGCWPPRLNDKERYLSLNNSSSSVGSLGSFDSSLSTTSAVSKRGVRVPGGYPCRHLGCGRAFDVPSQLRHHERNHAPAEGRPHACYCGARFLYPKDLARHSIKVHKKRAPKPSPDSSIADALSLILSGDDGTLSYKKRRRARVDSPTEGSPVPPRTDSCSGLALHSVTESKAVSPPHTGGEAKMPGWEDVTLSATSDCLASDQLEPADRFSQNDHMVTRAKRWLSTIDQVLLFREGCRTNETSDAIAHLSKRLDELTCWDSSSIVWNNS